MKSQMVLKVIKDVDERYGDLRYITLNIIIPPSFTNNAVIDYNIRMMLK